MITWDQLRWVNHWVPNRTAEPNCAQDIHLSHSRTLRVTRAKHPNGKVTYGFHVKPLLGDWETVHVHDDVTVAACRLVDMQMQTLPDAPSSIYGKHIYSNYPRR